MNEMGKTKFVENYISGLKRCLDALPLEQVTALINCLEQAYFQRKQVFIIGNGGSAATASHMACDLNKSVAVKGAGQEKPGFRVISLTDNVPWITAMANDFGYEHIFSEQLLNFCQETDLVIAVSGSGNSPNILEGIRVAKDRGAYVLGILGFDGGKAREMVDQYVLVQSDQYGYVEDIHMVLDHVVTTYFNLVYRPGREDSFTEADSTRLEAE